MTSHEWLRAGLLLTYTIISVLGMVLIKAADATFSVKSAIGFALYAGGFLLWIGVILRLMPLSQAFPLAAGMLLLGTQFAGWLALGEKLSPIHLGGVALILIGVVLVGMPESANS